MASDQELCARAEAVMQSWMSSEEASQARGAGLDKLQEPAGPLVLALNVGHVPVKSVAEELNGAAEEVVKNHAGVRVTFVVLKVLFPGWSSVGGDSESGGAKKGGGANKRSSAGGSEPKEKLTAMDGDSVRMFSYELVNKKGVYTRGARSESYACVHPGMVLSVKVWGSKVLATFKEDGSGCGLQDIAPFSLAFVQLGIKSVGCKAATSGMMLEIKSVQPAPRLSVSTRLLRAELLAHSIAESKIASERFATAVEGAENQEQEWLKGNLSSSVHALMVTPTPENGIFAMGPDGGIMLHVAQPLADLSCKAIDVRYDKSAFGVLLQGGGNDGAVVEGAEEWVAKALNLCCMLGAVEVLVILDTYKVKDISPDEVIVDGFARINTPALIRALLASQKIGLPQAVTDGHTLGYIGPLVQIAAKRHTVVFAIGGGGDAGGVDLALDLRPFTRKAGAMVVEEDGHAAGGVAKGCEPTGTLVHPNATWTRSHLLHFFLNGKPMLTALVNLGNAGSSAAERLRRALQSSALVHTLPGAECEVDDGEEEEPHPAAAPKPPASDAKEPAKKKSKGTAA